MRKVRDRETKWLGQGSEDHGSEPKWAGSKQCSSKCWSVLLHGTWMELMQIRDSPSAPLPSTFLPTFIFLLLPLHPSASTSVSLSAPLLPLFCVSTLFSFDYSLFFLCALCCLSLLNSSSLLLISAPYIPSTWPWPIIAIPSPISHCLTGIS